jgi:hypothetical protein
VTFVFRDHVDALRCRETEWLLERRAQVICEQRRLRTEELAIVRVLDERGRAVQALEADGVSSRTAHDFVETARALESLPEVAAAAHAGRLSDEQLVPVAQLADESSDAEWATRAPNTSPVDLNRMVRTQAKPMVEDSRRRQEARHLKLWWDASHSMLHLRGALPDLMGAEFEQTINRMVEQLKPPPGGAWDTFEHRAADSLLALCRRSCDGESEGDDGAAAEHGTRASKLTPTLAPKPVLVVHVPQHGTATVAGIPLPDAMVEQLRANATIEPVLVDERGLPVAIGRRESVLSSKITRGVLLRDGHCRWPGCDRRHGLEVHHLVPRSCGGSDDVANLAVVCATHHRQLVPHGPWVLTGNPNRPDGLRLRRHDEPNAGRRADRPRGAERSPPRAGPDP